MRIQKNASLQNYNKYKKSTKTRSINNNRRLQRKDWKRNSLPKSDKKSHITRNS